jgi:hypothetical protein
MGNQAVSKARPRSGMKLASAARTATGVGTAFKTEDVVNIEGTLVVSAHAGTTPTLDVRLETTVDGTNWDTVAAFPQQTGDTAGRGKAFAGLGRKCRWAWTIGGTTPSFTFKVDTKTLRGR